MLLKINKVSVNALRNILFIVLFSSKTGSSERSISFRSHQLFTLPKTPIANCIHRLVSHYSCNSPQIRSEKQDNQLQRENKRLTGQVQGLFHIKDWAPTRPNSVNKYFSILPFFCLVELENCEKVLVNFPAMNDKLRALNEKVTCAGPVGFFRTPAASQTSQLANMLSMELPQYACSYRLKQWTRASRFSPESYVDCEALLSSPVFDIFRSSYHNFDKKPLEDGETFASSIAQWTDMEEITRSTGNQLNSVYSAQRLRSCLLSCYNSSSLLD